MCMITADQQLSFQGKAWILNYSTAIHSRAT